MTNQGQNISFPGSDVAGAGHGQLRRDEVLNQSSNPSHDSSYASQASNLLQQTGEQVKSMAQGAAEAMKNTLGMNDDNLSGNHPGNIGRSNNPNHPSTKI